MKLLVFVMVVNVDLRMQNPATLTFDAFDAISKSKTEYLLVKKFRFRDDFRCARVSKRTWRCVSRKVGLFPNGLVTPWSILLFY